MTMNVFHKFSLAYMLDSKVIKDDARIKKEQEKYREKINSPAPPHYSFFKLIKLEIKIH